MNDDIERIPKIKNDDNYETTSKWNIQIVGRRSAEKGCADREIYGKSTHDRNKSTNVHSMLKP